jgi:hypothetical protein
MEKIINDIKLSDSIPIIQLKEILGKSSQNLTDKWTSGRKSLRTEIAIKVIPNYPSKALQTALTIDSIVNLIDDNLDDLMSKQERTLYTIELVRNLANFNQQEISNESRKKYLNISTKFYASELQKYCM